MTDNRGINRAQASSADVSTSRVAPPPPSPVADELIVPTRGGRAARARGVIFRRLLALSDALALLAAFSVSYLAVLGTSPGSLAWTLAFSPIWILVIKLHGLYDQDHRRIRHSTLDELPALVS